MHWSNRFIDINTSNSLFNVSRPPEATRFLSLAYAVFTLVLFLLRRSAYHHMIKNDPNTKLSSIVSPTLQLIPAAILKHPYSIVLSNFIDTEIWKILVNAFFLLIGGSYIEKNWNSSKELLKFVIIIGSLTNLLVVIITFLLSFVFSGVSLNVPLDGNYTMMIGFPIVFKQLYPETTILQLRNVGFFSKNFRFKLLPIFIMSLLTIFQLIFFHHFAQLLSIWITFFACWTYLRFYQFLKPSNEDSDNFLVGDASDTFQLTYLFPDIVKPILRPIFDFAYQTLCVRLKIIRPFQSDDIDKGNSVAEQRGAKKIVDPVEERRKQLALQVLQERLAEP